VSTIGLGPAPVPAPAAGLVMAARRVIVPAPTRGGGVRVLGRRREEWGRDVIWRGKGWLACPCDWYGL
jgi:hypothetical protein